MNNDLTQNKRLNIYQKLLQASKHPSVRSCKKNGIMGYKSNISYQYFKAEDVIEAAHKAFAEFGIIMEIKNVNIHIKDITITRKNIVKKDKKEESSIQDQSQKKAEIEIYDEKNMLYLIEGEVHFVNIDDKDDRSISYFTGSSISNDDKGIGKANTYAKKIALMNILMIQDGEDTDSENTADNKGISINKTSSQADQNTPFTKTLSVETVDKFFVDQLKKYRFIEEHNTGLYKKIFNDKDKFERTRDFLIDKNCKEVNGIYKVIK